MSEPGEASIKHSFDAWRQDRVEEQVTDLTSLLNLYRKWLYLEETEDIEVMLACLLDREIPGDPIWLQVIASSGDKKTEILRSFSGYEKAYSLDMLTTKTLVSGLSRRNPDTGELEPVAGLLPRINGKVLIIKDFTTTLGKSEEYRTELYGQLRSIYDGYFEAGFGTLPDPIRLECKMGFIAACTPAIDRYTKMENDLGTRFLKVRSESDPVEATRKALENAMVVGRMRFQLRNAVSNFIEALHKRGAFREDQVPLLTEEQKQEIIEIASYVAKMRATVWARYDRYGDLLTLEAINEEKPTRVAKQMMKLAQLLAIIRGREEVTDADLGTVRRVARDTSEPTRQRIMDCFRGYGTLEAHLSVSDIDGITKRQGKRIHYRTAKNALEIMYTLGIVDRDEHRNYTITESFKSVADHVYTPLPEVTSEKEAEKGVFSEATRVKGIYTPRREGGKTTLQDKLEIVLSAVAKTSLLTGLSKHETLLGILEEIHGIGEVEASRLLGTLERDGQIFRPRPGYWKVT